MTDWIGGLERLKQLREQGHLSDEEFQNAKARLLTNDPPSDSETPQVQAPADGPDVRWSDVGEPGDEGSLAWRKPIAIGAVLAAVAAGGVYAWTAPGSSSRPTGEAVLQADVNCRSTPGLDGDIREVLTEGTSVKVAESRDGWSRASTQGCWVKDTYLSAVEPIESDPAAPAPPVSNALIPAVYDFTRNPSQEAIAAAHQILANSTHCIGRPQYEVGNTYADFDLRSGEVVYVVKARTGDLLPDNEATFERDGLTLRFSGAEGTLKSISLDVKGLTQEDSENAILHLGERQGGSVVPQAEPRTWSGTDIPIALGGWWLRCGIPGQGSAKWQSQYQDVSNVISLVRD